MAGKDEFAMDSFKSLPTISVLLDRKVSKACLPQETDISSTTSIAHVSTGKDEFSRSDLDLGT